MIRLALWFLLTAPLSAELVRYWALPSPASDLATFAMEGWARASSGKLTVQKVDAPEDADLRFYFVTPRTSGLYGQSIPRREGDRIVYQLVINTSIAGLGPDMLAATKADPLLADVILYLTCVHESGHALGLDHTRNFADIMYSFEYGGDFVEYFARFRRQLKSRNDMSRLAPISPGDSQQLIQHQRRTQKPPAATPRAPQP